MSVNVNHHAKAASTPDKRDVTRGPLTHRLSTDHFPEFLAARPGVDSSAIVTRAFLVPLLSKPVFVDAPSGSVPSQAYPKVHGPLLVLNFEERPPRSVASPPSLESEGQPVWPDDVHAYFSRMQVANRGSQCAATQPQPERNGCLRGESCHKLYWETVPVRVADAPEDALIAIHHKK